MSFLTRFVLRTWLPQVLWAVDTPFEPLLSGRRRAVPLSDEDIDQQTLGLLDSYVYQAARTLSRWLIWGAALTLGAVVLRELYPWIAGGSVAVLSMLLDSSDAQVARAITFSYWAYALISISAVVIWIACGGASMVRTMKEPISELDNRLILTLKRGVTGPRTLALLDSLPADSAYRLYLAPALKRASRRA